MMVALPINLQKRVWLRHLVRIVGFTVYLYSSLSFFLMPLAIINNERLKGRNLFVESTSRCYKYSTSIPEKKCVTREPGYFGVSKIY